MIKIRLAAAAAVLILAAECTGCAAAAPAQSTAQSAPQDTQQTEQESPAEEAAPQEQKSGQEDVAPQEQSTPQEAEQEGAASEAPAETADYTGKSLTIIGDSISTFYGYNPEGYAFTYPYEDLQDVSQTWWVQVCEQTGMSLYSNASYSGGYVTGDTEDETGITAIGKRRLADAAVPLRESAGDSPDVIMILAGTNDCWQARELPVFSDAYDYLLTQLSERFPEAEIICLTCLPILDPNNGTPVTMPYGELLMMQNQNGQNITVYNDLIREAAEKHGAGVIDAFNAGLESGDYIDGVHPNAQGAEKLAQYITDRLLTGPLT